MKILSFLNYFLLIALATVIIGLVYGTVQQSYRTSADDPQVQMVEEIKTKLMQGKAPADVLPRDKIDLAHSLSPFIALYDASGTPLYSTGVLNDQLPKLPHGVFEVAKNNGDHRVTWQPQVDVRMAVVLASLNAASVNFIAAGRSLKEVEQRESNLGRMVFIAWIICLAVVLLSAAIGYYKHQQTVKQN